MDQSIYSVIEITRNIKSLFERNFPSIAIEGEISNFKPHYSGHAYFSLKDEAAQISAVMWRSTVERSDIQLSDGKKVICYGQITIYEKTGRYQLIINRIEEAGKGDLHQRFEELKKLLSEKGYFNQERKRKIKLYPMRIGIVTSPTGAAIQDMISVAKRRNQSVELIIRAAKVQGNDAALDIAKGIKEFNDYAKVDVIVIGRGGGSLEDLWAFNEEIVADAIYHSKIPILSAVGHEVDFSISDFVADKRAATPSAAMEILIPDQNEIEGQLRYFSDKIYQLIKNILYTHSAKIESIKNHYALKKSENLIAMKSEQLDALQLKINQLMNNQLINTAQNFWSLKKQIEALAPQNVLKRGYTILLQNEKVVDQSDHLENGDVKIMFKDKTIDKKIS